MATNFFYKKHIIKWLCVLSVFALTWVLFQSSTPDSTCSNFVYNHQDKAKKAKVAIPEDVNATLKSTLAGFKEKSLKELLLNHCAEKDRACITQWINEHNSSDLTQQVASVTKSFFCCKKDGRYVCAYYKASITTKDGKTFLLHKDLTASHSSNPGKLILSA